MSRSVRPQRLSTIPPRPRHDLRRIGAQVLCGLFGILGALPILLGFAIKSDEMHRWVSRETQRVLHDQLQLNAEYQATIELWPLTLELQNVSVPSSDAKGPAVLADRVAIRPRIFSLIAGQLDVGDIEVEGAKQRLVFEQGKLQNLHVRLPEGKAGAGTPQAPFSSLSMSDASFELDIDGNRISVQGVDLDVFPDAEQSFEIALRVGESWVHMNPNRYPSADNGSRDWDGDVLCQLDARIRLEQDGALIRRLGFTGAADIDPASGTAPNCLPTTEEPPGRIALKAHQLRISRIRAEAPWSAHGELSLRAPSELQNRFAPNSSPFGGWAELNGTIAYDGSTRLPGFRGKLKTSELRIGETRLMQGAEGDVELQRDRIFVSHMLIQYGTGSVTAKDVVLAPLEPGLPFSAKYTRVSKVPFPTLMSNLDITDDTVVPYMIDSATVTDFEGTLHPTRLDGQMSAEVTDFEVTRGSYRSPTRQRMFGLNSRGYTRGSFSVRPDSIQFNSQHVRFGNSSLNTTVHVGFEDAIFLTAWDSKIDLSDISPLVTVPIKGVMHLNAKMDGKGSDPTLTSDVSIENLEFGGFPIGDVERSKLTFRPLWLELQDTIIKKGESRLRLPKSRIDFEAGTDLEVDAHVVADHLRIVDFLKMWRFDEDPRWREVSGQASARTRVQYALGGKGDPCGEGRLRVTGNIDLDRFAFFGEVYDGGHAEIDLDWIDTEASYHGMTLDIPSLQLRKGNGSLLGNFRISAGALVNGNLVGTALPLSRLDGLGNWGKVMSGNASTIIEIGGTLDRMTAEAQVDIGTVLIGRSQLEPSQLNVKLEPAAKSTRFLADRKTKCGRPIPEPSKVEDLETQVDGTFHVKGHLFGGQVVVNDLEITRQEKKVAKGRLKFERLDLRPVLELSPEVALMKQRPSGSLSGQVEFERLPLDAPHTASAKATIDQAELRWAGFSASVDPKLALEVNNGRVRVRQMTLRVAPEGGQGTVFDVEGEVANLDKDPSLDMNLNLRPVSLQGFSRLLPQARNVEGTLAGKVKLTGTVNQPSYSGGFTLTDGAVEFRGSPLALSDVDFEISLDNAGVNITKATAAVGGGTLSATGAVPMRGFKPELFQAQVHVKDVSLPVTRGVDVTVDSDLEISWDPRGLAEDEDALPKIGGEVSITSFEYSRAVTMNADISTLTGRPKRTQFESYDPEKDSVELDILVTSRGPLKLNNNLIEADLQLEPPGLRLTGTNQRFGLRGSMKVLPGGRIRLRRNEFEVQAGKIQFDDPTRIAPRVDVTAVTEYRRFSSTTSTGASSTSTASNSTSAASTGATGQWRINMHAYGDAENLKLDLTSQPKLSQDDIFLLLTVGLTRAELDQAQSASLGESVALEALGSLTGADSAVSEAIPAIDEFRFGSAYSARTGRTEPTVTVGKRLSERIRAYVTSGISESREVRSNLEWRLQPGVSVEGSYDNVNDISSSSIGNLGADVRWRLEFE